MASKKKFSIEEAIRFGWNVMKENYSIFITLFFINVAFYIIRWAVYQVFPKDNYAIAIISYVINAIITIGTLKVLLLLVRGKKTEFPDLFSILPILFQYIIASILDLLIIAGGLMLLIIPGIIWGIKFQYFGYVLVDKKCGPIEALKKSAAITKGNLFNLFLFELVVIVLNIAGALCLLIGLFVTVPTTMVAKAYVYRKLAGK